MFLSRLILDPRNPGVRRDLASVTAMHSSVMRAFGPAPDHARKHHDVLWRSDEVQGGGAVYLYVQSKTEPAWSFLPEGYLGSAPWGEDSLAVKSLADAWGGLHGGQKLRFRLLANATRRISRDGGGSTRVPLRTPDALEAWLVRKATQSGFTFSGAQLLVQPRPPQRGSRAGSQLVTIESTLFEGLLEINNIERFRAALQSGLGSAKAYGCGLLSIARI